MRKLSCLAVIALSGFAFTPCSATETRVTVSLPLEVLEAPDAGTILRSIAGVRDLAVEDLKTLRITAEPEVVELAKLVIELAEHPNEVTESVPTHSAADGTVIASVHLQHTAVYDVMTALRQVGVGRVAGNDTLSTILIRDSPEKVDAALVRIRQMEAEPAPKQ